MAIGLPNLARIIIDRGSRDRPRALLLEGLAIAREIGSARGGQNVVEVPSGLAVLCEHWNEAARFFGASEAQVEQMSMHRPPVDEAFIARRIAKAREVLGDAAFAAAEAAGRALTYEQALDDVGAWLSSVG